MITRSFIVAVLFALAHAAPLRAHPADISQLRVRMEHDRVEFRFSMNIATIARVVAIDSNQDNKVTYAEIEAAVPAMRAFLSKATLISVNDEETNLGEFKGSECVWPNAPTSEITPQDAGQRFVDFNFTQPWPKGVEDVWLGFKVFEHLGDLHVIQCLFQQPGEPDAPVEFSVNEPDYLYDTGWKQGTSGSPSVSPPSAATSSLSVWILGAVTSLLLVAGLVVKLRRARQRRCS